MKQSKVTRIEGKLNSVPYPLPVAGTWEQVIAGLLYKLHVFTNLGLCDLTFGILLKEEVIERIVTAMGSTS